MTFYTLIAGVNEFSNIVDRIKQTFDALPDKRTGANTQYSMQDAALSAFAVFFMQSPSFLGAQRAMQNVKNSSNMSSLFMTEKIPSDNQIRNLLDPVDPEALFPIYDAVYNEFKTRGILEKLQTLNGSQLIAFDGTWYHSSGKIHCENCLSKQHRNGAVTYYHSAITPVIVTPHRKEAIALRPEFIMPQDGSEKQDCEINAAKRWLEKNAALYAENGSVTILGDDLYSRQPFCRQLLLQGLHLIFVCKKTSHSFLYDWVEELEDGIDLHTVNRRTCKVGKNESHTLRFASEIPLADGENALRVNWIEHTVKVKGKQVYHNAFVTDHEIGKENALEIAEAGRARWKIENENNNTLKTKGYHLEHNFGHGKQHLSSLLASMNILAFLIHTLLDNVDAAYGILRSALGSRRTFFEHVRTLTHYQRFESWDAMMDFMMQGLEVGPYDSG